MPLGFIGRIPGFQLSENILQSVESDFIERTQPHSQFAFGKAFSVEPYQIVFGNIAEQSPFILAKRHCFGHQIDENFRVHGIKVRFFPSLEGRFPASREAGKQRKLTVLHLETQDSHSKFDIPLLLQKAKWIDMNPALVDTG
jgi:hypothetical protein